MELASTQQAAHTSSHACLSSESGDNFHIISSERTFCSFPASGWAKLELCCASFRAESKKVTFQAQHKECGGIWVSRDPSAKKAPGQLQNITTSMRAPPSPATPKKNALKRKNPEQQIWKHEGRALPCRSYREIPVRLLLCLWSNHEQEMYDGYLE